MAGTSRFLSHAEASDDLHPPLHSRRRARCAGRVRCNLLCRIAGHGRQGGDFRARRQGDPRHRSGGLFHPGQAGRRQPDFTHEWKGATWYFSSAANRDRFKENPERWAPQYGGYCAYGVAQGYAVKIEVDQWSVVDGKLYLNYSRSVQRTWKQDIPGYIREANKNWPEVLK